MNKRKRLNLEKTTWNETAPTNPQPMEAPYATETFVQDENPASPTCPSFPNGFIPWERKKRTPRVLTPRKHPVMDPETFLHSQKSAILLAMRRALTRPKNRMAKLEATLARLESQRITYAEVRAFEERIERMKASLREANREFQIEQKELERLTAPMPVPADRNDTPDDTRNVVVNLRASSRKFATLRPSEEAQCPKGFPTAPKTLDEASALHISGLLQRWQENGLTDGQCCKLLQIYLGLEEFLTPDGVYPGDTIHLIAKKFFSHHTRDFIQLMEKSGSFTFLVTPDKKACYGCFSHFRINRKILRGNSDILRQTKHIEVGPHARMAALDEWSIANFETEDKVYILLNSITNINGMTEQLIHPNQPSHSTTDNYLSSGGLKKEVIHLPRKAVSAERRNSPSGWETSPFETPLTLDSKSVAAPVEAVAEGEEKGPESAPSTHASDAKSSRQKPTVLPLLTTPAKVKAAQEREAIDYGSAEDFFRELANTTTGKRFLRSIERGLMKEYRVNTHQAGLMMKYLVQEELTPYYNRLKKFHHTQQQGRFIWLTRLVNSNYFCDMKRHAYEACHNQIRAIDAENSRRIVEQEYLNPQPEQPEEQDPGSRETRRI